MKLSFHGAAREVTGSCFLLQSDTTRILVDCGLHQGERISADRNFEPFTFRPMDIDAVVVTHSHIDHVGRLPKLVREGFTGPVYMTEPTEALSRLVLADAHKIMTENAERYGDRVLYEALDLEKCMKQCAVMNYHNQFLVGDMSIMYHDAGHILGSAYVSVDTAGKRVVFSGDIGNDHVPILSDTEPISHADIVVCESTYGHRIHEPVPTRTKMLQEAIETVLNDKGVLLIPAFSVERTQELLYELNNMLPDIHKNIPIILDSPLAIRATELYRHYKNFLHFDASIIQEADRDFFSFPGLVETLTTEESKRIAEIPTPKIIIAGSGMMTGGRILHHLRRYIGDRRNTILIVGYVAQGTLGRRIFEGERFVNIFHEKIPLNARVRAIGAFSAHGDRNKLTRWLMPEDKKIPKQIFLVHGDPEAKEVFATHLRHELRTEVIIPEYNQEFFI